MNAFRLGAVVMAIMLVAGCATRGNVADDSRPAISPLPMPSVPKIITDPSARAEYAAIHFWEQLEAGDTIDPGVFEQDVANYAAIASLAGAQARRQGWTVLWQKRGDHVEALMPVIEDYLWEPASPVYSPDLFASAIDAADSLELIGAGERWQMIREEIRQNEPGTKAADFAYIDRDGTRRHLTGTHRRQLLIIYDPECANCAEEMRAVEESEELTSDFDIVAIYPGGDYETWRDHAATLPPTWTVGMNPATPIGTLDAWTVRTVPQLYILDDSDRVVWRGASATSLRHYRTLHIPKS